MTPPDSVVLLTLHVDAFAHRADSIITDATELI